MLLCWSIISEFNLPSRSPQRSSPWSRPSCRAGREGSIRVELLASATPSKEANGEKGKRKKTYGLAATGGLRGGESGANEGKGGEVHELHCGWFNLVWFLGREKER